MPKIKMPRKSTAIDMTAMCDVAFLLLTFFMLATSFKPPEAVVVRTPGSTSTKPIPEGFILITLDKDGRVFYNIDDLNAKRAVIEQVNQEKGLGLTSAEMQSFVIGTDMGVKFSQLKSYLALDGTQQKDFAKTAPGIPTDTTADYERNELAFWLATTQYHLPKGRIAIKADGAAAYPEINKVISTLGKLKLFRFNFITDPKGIPPGTALFEEQMVGTKAGH
jgi:biopolymer transport protein ExbD